MKTTSRILTAWTAAGITLTAGMAWAGPHCSPLSGLWGATLAGQAGAASVDDKKRAVADLLGRARNCMKEGNLELADSLVSRAEKENVSYPKLHLGDTPKKARADLNRLLKSKGGSTKLPSQKFQAEGPDAALTPGFDVNNPAKGAGKSEPRDPFAVRQDGFEPTAKSAAPRGIADVDPRAALAPPSDAEKQGNLPTGKGFPDSSPFGKQTIASPPNGTEAGLTADQLPAKDPLRTQSDRMLLEARLALAVGDVRRASQLAAQAKQLGARYDFHDDSPAKVEDAVNRYSRLNAPGGPAKESEAYRRQQSECLMQQCEALMNWGELDEADRLASDAERLGVNYGPFDAKPASLRQRIAAARSRRGGAESQIEPLPPVGDHPAPLAEQTGPAAPLDAATASRKQQALQLVEQALQAKQAGDLDRAESLAEQAEELRVPDHAFQKGETRPWMVLYQIQQAEKERQGVVPAGGAAAIGADDRRDGRYPAAQAMYDRNRDATENVPASRRQEAIGPGETAQTLYERGEEALRNRDIPAALSWFRQANERRGELDPATQQQLQDKLQLLSQSTAVRKPAGGNGLMNQAAAEGQLNYRRVSAEINQKEQAARNLQESNPKQAMELLKQARGIIEEATLDSQAREILLRRINHDVDQLEQFIDANRGRIELNERNNATRTEIDRERQVKIEVQEKVALLVDEFNKLMDEHRYAEAEILAKQAREIAPDEPVVKQIGLTAKMVRRVNDYQDVADAKEQGFITSLHNVDKSAIPYDDNKPYQFGPVKDWARLTESRRAADLRNARQRSEKELEIEQKLKTPISLRFQEMPLSQVIEELGKLAQVNMYLDARGLAEEAVNTDTPVTIELSQEISLKSALHLILEPLHLSYVIKDEVLRITSENLRDGEVVTKTYNVADLVIPIPNFAPSAYMGLTGALRDAQSSIPMYGGMGGGDSPLQVVTSNNGATGNAMLGPDMLAQMSSASSAAISAAGGTPTPGFGPGGLGGGGSADFTSLIELITSTVAPTTWDEVGGPGAIQQFAGNLSLVISQTQEVHEEIADLLTQLRRLQDLQVTIEVRFITLNDNFFERIGVNFDFAIPTYAQKKFQVFGDQFGDSPPTTNPTLFNALQGGVQNGPSNLNLTMRDLRKQNSVTIGLQGSNTSSMSAAGNLDIPFGQNSFAPSIPQFGGYTPGLGGATLGFAILSNIETFFVIEASQGDRRTNVLQAPKVTLFNGQQANVFDVTQTPFVISVIPVVGAFAAAQQPVIIVLNEGTALTVQAVVSNDRRFVRLTLVPFFSTITAVNTFTFAGSSTTTSGNSSTGPVDNTTARNNSTTTSSEGTTVQLPSFSFVSVNTTVSVPDGGTVLLGGVKRLSEGRNEFGVPLLGKIPYLSRLFRNVGIGRETQSLMMMVTPRIIIQEEEEEALGIPLQ